MTGSNCRPSRCKRDALPTELIAHNKLGGEGGIRTLGTGITRTTV